MATRREALEAAFDELENPDEPKVDQPLDEEGSEGAERHSTDEGDKKDGEGSEAQDEGGEKKLEQKTEKKTETPEEKEQKAAARAAKTDGQRPPTSTDQTQTKPPASWSPALREKWGSIPADARAHILKREREIDGVMRESAGVKKFGQDLAQIVNPHLGMIQAMNSQPLPAIKSLLDTAGQLYTGNSETKAGVVAQLIWRYGVDIKTLDHILANKKMPNGQPLNDQHMQRGPEAPPSWAQPLFQFMDQAQQARQQMTQRQMQESQAEIQDFAEKAPFFEDVREEVADLMEAAYNRGRVLTLQQAYDRAVALNPEISAIIEQRKTAARQQSSNVGRARRAASTIKGAPSGGGGGGNKPKSRREAIEEAWDNAEG